MVSPPRYAPHWQEMPVPPENATVDGAGCHRWLVQPCLSTPNPWQGFPAPLQYRCRLLPWHLVGSRTPIGSVRSLRGERPRISSGTIPDDQHAGRNAAPLLARRAWRADGRLRRLVDAGAIQLDRGRTPRRRAAVGLFDVSHMGRFRFVGSGGGRLLESLLTRRVAGMQPGQIRYALVTNDAGGILDDVLVYHLPNASDGDELYQLVVNASNRQKIWDWLVAHRGRVRRRSMSTSRSDTAMIAVQGPRALGDRRAAGVGRSAIAALLSRRRGPIGRLFRAHQPHRLHRRGRLRAGRAGRCGPGSVAKTDDGCRRPLAGWPPGSAPATRCGSKPPCRSTATSSTNDRSVPGRPRLCRRSGGPRLSRPRRAGEAARGNRPTAPHRLANRRPPRRSRRLPRARRRPPSRPRHQRHLFAHARSADRHGLCRARAGCRGQPLSDRHPRPLEPARSVALPFYRRPKTAKP